MQPHLGERSQVTWAVNEHAIGVRAFVIVLAWSTMLVRPPLGPTVGSVVA